MYELDRIAVVLRPTEALLNWLTEQPNQDPSLDLNDLCNDCTTLLIPGFTSPDEAFEFLEERYAALFDNELASLGVPAECWPNDRNFELFNEWFDVEFHSLVYDLVEEDVLIDEEAF